MKSGRITSILAHSVLATQSMFDQTSRSGEIIVGLEASRYES